LAKDFTVHVIERRGRGLSGPQGKGYDISKECEDVAAVQQATRAAFIVGHSYGGLVALESARNNSQIRGVAVYEPGVSIDGAIPIYWLKPYEQNLRVGKRADAFVQFIKAMDPRSRRTPDWLFKLILPRAMGKTKTDKMYGLLETSLHEHQQVARLDNSFRNYAQISASTLFVYGSKGMQSSPLNAQKLRQVIPQYDYTCLNGLNHFDINEKGATDIAVVIGRFFQSMLGKNS
jgi:pimeloyl-ACP methyl ester carboxylesterase